MSFRHSSSISSQFERFDFVFFFGIKLILLRDEILHRQPRSIRYEHSYLNQYLPRKHVVS